MQDIHLPRVLAQLKLHIQKPVQTVATNTISAIRTLLPFESKMFNFLRVVLSERFRNLEILSR